MSTDRQNFELLNKMFIFLLKHLLIYIYCERTCLSLNLDFSHSNKDLEC